MNSSDLKRFLFLPVTLLILSISILSSTAQAADIQAQLDNTNGSGFSVQNSSSTEVARVDNTGNLTAYGNVGIGTTSSSTSAALTVSMAGGLPQYPIGGGVYIQNDLEVDNMSYLNQISATGAYTQSGASPNAFTGVSTFSTNVGVGTLTPRTTLDVASPNVDAGLSPNATFLSQGGGLYVQNNLEVDGNVWLGHNAAVNNLTVLGQMNLAGGETLDKLTVSGNTFLATTSGNVGIGTINPGSLLSVLGGLSLGTYAINTAPAGGMVISGNVGIATTTPDMTLDVRGTGIHVGPGSLTHPSGSGGDLYVTNNLQVDGNTWLGSAAANNLTVTGSMNLSGNVTFTNLEVTGNTFLGTVAGNLGIGTTAAHGNLEIMKLGSASPFLVSSTAAGNGDYLNVSNGGNVGIGSTHPGQLLDVNGNIRTRGTNALYFGDDNKAFIQASAASSGAMKFLTNNAEAMRITNAGNIGVGTTTPQGALTVMSGNVGVGTWAPNALLSVATGPVTGFEYGNLAASAGTGVYVQNDLAVDGTAYLENAQIDGVLTVAGSLDLTGQTTFDTLEVTGNTYLGTGGNGNVGIGTTAAHGLLEILKSASNPTAPLLMLSSTPNGGGNYLIVNSTGNVGIGSAAPNASLAIGANAFKVTSSGLVTTSGAYTQTGNGINTFTGNLGIGTTMPVGALAVMSGNVGIGTWVPNALLSVATTPVTGPEYANLALGVGAGNDAYVQNDLAVDGTAYLFNAQIDGTLTVDNLALTGQTTFDKLEVTGNTFLGTIAGNVGIGTTAAYGNLEIMKLANGQPALMVSSSAANHGNYLMVTNNGNVGVGTTGPQAVLAVGPTSQFQVNATGSITTSGTITQTGGANTFSGITAFNAGITSATFTGNVGIGSLSPGQKLDVQGTVRTTGFAMTGQSPLVGYVLTASDSSGNATWSPAGGIEGWTVFGGNVYTTVGNENVGIGTTTPQGGFVVTNGNVGIGTWAPAALLAVGPGSPFQVNSNGAITTTGITTSGPYTQSNNGINSFTGNVGLGTPAPTGRLEIEGGNVGIGTAFTTAAGMTVMNGNVGIGTWAPQTLLEISTGGGTVLPELGPGGVYVQNNLEVDGTAYLTDATVTGTLSVATLELSGDSVFSNIEVTGNSFLGTVAGNVGIGTTAAHANLEIMKIGSQPALMVSSSGANHGNYLMVANNGNVGIGSINPSQNLDVQGTIRTTNFAMTGQSPLVGYVLTASDTNGNATWSSAGGIAGWTVSGSNVYTTVGSDNVGIGTSTPQGGLVVTNGNVGIGTWAPGGLLDVQGTATHLYVSASGNVGIGSANPYRALDVVGSMQVDGQTSNMFLNINGLVSDSNYFGIAGNRAFFGYDGSNNYGGTTNTVVQATATKGIEFNVNNSTYGLGNAMYLSSAGNLGIGTAAPRILCHRLLLIRMGMSALGQRSPAAPRFPS